MINFAQPAWLFGLLLLPLLALIHWQRVERERQALDAFCREDLLAKMATPLRQDAKLVRGLLILGAIACGLVALSQPRWGLSAAESLIAKDGSVVIALDVSKSMLARDAGARSRLEEAQRMLGEVLPGLPGWKVGLVAFAGEGQALVPLTTDHTAVETLLERARPGVVPGTGSNLEAGLQAALALFNKPGKRVVLVFSDGESHKGNPLSLVAKLRQEKIDVVTIGLGSAEGAPVPGAPDLWGNPTTMQYRGEPVVSRLDDRTLKRLASDAGGTYMAAADPTALARLKAQLGSRSSRAMPDEMPEQGFELFQVPLLLMLLLVLAEAGWALWGRPRPEVRFADHLHEALGSKRGSWWSSLAAKLRRPAAAFLLVIVAQSQAGFSFIPSWVPNREAGAAIEAGDLDLAVRTLTEAIEADPHNFRLHYNRGVAQYQRSDWGAASRDFQRAWELADEKSRPMIGYNLGNALFRLAESTQDTKGYQRAVTEYERVLAKTPEDDDARHNLAVAKARLKQAQKPSQQQAGGGQGSQGSGQGSGQPTVGAQPQRKPLPEIKNLPSEAEVDALLKALEADERQRQAEAGAEAPANDPFNADFGQNLLQQALGTLSNEKDW